MFTSLSRSLSSNSSLSIVSEQPLDTKDKQQQHKITHQNSDASIIHHPKLNLEPTRFPSLTFISQNNSNADRETSIKNANLKSELIENTKESKKAKDPLFNNTALPINYIPQTSANVSLNMNSGSSVSKMGSSNTLQSVYTDAYSALDFDDSGNMNHNSQLNQNHFKDIVDGIPTNSPMDLQSREDNSIYQQSIYSNNPENYYVNHNVQNYNNNHNHPINNGTVIHFTHPKRDNESFIYNDEMNSVDILSLTDQKIQRKLSNGIVFLNSSLFNNNFTAGNFHTNTNTTNINANTNNDLDFLDNQSLSTIVTNNDGVPSLNNNATKSPILRRQPNCSNSISVSPTFSKVRQVSQRIFSNYNNSSNKTPGINNSIKHKLNKKGNNTDFSYVPEENVQNTDYSLSHNLDDYDDVDETTGFTDAESFLAKPFKSNKSKKKTGLKNISYNKLVQHNNLNLKNSTGNISNGIVTRQQKVHDTILNKNPIKQHRGEINIENNEENMHIKVDDSRYRNYGSIKHTYFDSIGEYNDNYDAYYDGTGSPHNYKSMYYRQNMLLKFILLGIYIFVLLMVLCSVGKILALKNFDNTLKNFEVIKLDNLLLSDDILLIDVKSQARNINLQDIEIWEMDLDIFLVTDESMLIEKENSLFSNDITILLGNSMKFLTPFKFSGLLSLPTWHEVWDRWEDSSEVKPVHSTAQLKLYQPGKNFVYHDKELSHDQWLRIFNSKFKIILRGNLKYKLPLTWQDEFISISTEVEMNPSELMNNIKNK